ncbi:MAG: lysophospholipid acyltransferase family protein [Planctomycetota bacterium]|nr:lysophospholipid acyltransferase family protein [Planctomycetota bacterium]
MSFWDRLKYFLIRWFGYALLHIIGMSVSLRFSCRHLERQAHKNGRRCIYAFWHGRLLLLAFSHRRRKIHIMISEHRDGEIITQVTRQMGFGAVRGSTTRGGTKALKALCRALEKYDGAITPDGPRGPGYKVQPGVITAAQLSGRPIVPVTSASYPRFEFKSWDRFILPKIFSCCVVRFGTPLEVPRRLSEEEFEKFRILLEDKMNKLVKEADELAKRWYKRGVWREMAQSLE